MGPLAVLLESLFPHYVVSLAFESGYYQKFSDYQGTECAAYAI